MYWVFHPKKTSIFQLGNNGFRGLKNHSHRCRISCNVCNWPLANRYGVRHGRDRLLATQVKLYSYLYKIKFCTAVSVADPGCLFRIVIFIYRGSNNSNKRGWGKKWVVLQFCIHKFQKIWDYFIFEQVQKKVWANWQNYSTFYPKTSEIRDLWKKPIPDPWVKKAPDLGSGSAKVAEFM
jgi:hypothetical protein